MPSLVSTSLRKTNGASLEARNLRVSSVLLLASGMASLGGLLFGFDLGVAGGLLPQLSKEFHLEDFQQTLFVSSFPCAAAVASCFCGVIVDCFGRRRTILATALVSMVASAALATSASLELLIFGRALMGASVAISIVADTMFVAEISPSSCRGRLVTANELAVCLGILLALFVDWIIPQGHWRWAFVFPILIVTAQICILLYLPPSPRWLLMKRRIPQAIEALRMLRQVNDNRMIWEELKSIDMAHPPSTRVLNNFDDFGEDREFLVNEDDHLLDFDNRSTPNETAQIRSSYMLALLISCTLVILQNFSGQGVLFYFAPVVFREAGMDVNASLASAVWMGIVKLISTLVALLTIDRIGRRPLLFLGASMMLIAQILIAFALRYQTVQKLQYCAIIGTLVYVSGYSFSFGPNGWLFQNEIFNDHNRAKAAGISSIVNWTSMMMVTLTFLPLSDLIGDSTTFLIFAVFSVVALLFIFFIVPETNQKTFEQIEYELSQLSRRLKIC